MIFESKNIHIGSLIEKRVQESGIDMTRICNFFKCNETSIRKVYSSKSIDSDLLLKWCKLLEYDFFRMYTQHLILYSPATKQITAETTLPRFRKNIYTKEIIDYILDLVQTGEKSKKQIIDEYKIPKTTLYKWISKYNVSQD
ncbi:Helix-turn-helix domain of resolvase [Chryseobacterium oleae]|uniref:Helix-turn-helix domain of resolvase n=1 Tax=Chryseobacterium oleae TaxID=491207 RepID=A0A1I4YIS8_CHROL|nr:helix-turn-helix domain-containing protein [Chryseobacterium oleae]SFN37897.1 Helix-turn-helix domain of resolvase [Chryseobacterium oleae]